MEHRYGISISVWDHPLASYVDCIWSGHILLFHICWSHIRSNGTWRSSMDSLMIIIIIQVEAYAYSSFDIGTS